MRENDRRCPGCDKKKAISKASRFNGKEWPGSLCKHCGLFLPDIQTKRYALSCADCGEIIPGTKSLPYQFHEHDARWQERHNKELNGFYCVDCHKDRHAAGNTFDEDTFVRHQVHCSVCDKVLLWLDLPESKSQADQAVAISRSQGTCSDECTARAAELRSNQELLDASILKKTTGG